MTPIMTMIANRIHKETTTAVTTALLLSEESADEYSMVADVDTISESIPDGRELYVTFL